MPNWRVGLSGSFSRLHFFSGQHLVRCADVLTVACWNTEWHAPSSPRGAKLKAALLAKSPDIVCLPEARHDFLDEPYHGIMSDPDHGYPVRPDRSKVTLWSRWPWQDVDRVGDVALPPGRFIAATTSSSIGPVRVVGVCVPWKHAHVTSGSRDRAVWQDHGTYLVVLPRVLERQRNFGHPLIIAGDFNQRIPARLVPPSLAEMLAGALSDIKVWTTEIPAGLEKQALCHVATDATFSASEVKGISRIIAGVEVSDHDGLVAALLGA